MLRIKCSMINGKLIAKDRSLPIWEVQVLFPLPTCSLDQSPPQQMSTSTLLT